MAPHRWSTIAGVIRAMVVYRWRPRKRRRLMRFYARFCGPGDTVFDVGALVGGRTIVFHRLGARVVAFEPQPARAAQLDRLAARLARSAKRAAPITVVAAALADRAGTVPLYPVPRNPSLATICSAWAARAATHEPFQRTRFGAPLAVDAQTLDQAIATYGVPDFVKIDVEGAEDRVIAGLSHAVARLSFEALSVNAVVALRAFDAVVALGCYEFARSTGESLVLSSWSAATPARARLAELLHAGWSGDVYARRVTPQE